MGRRNVVGKTLLERRIVTYFDFNPLFPVIILTLGIAAVDGGIQRSPFIMGVIQRTMLHPISGIFDEPIPIATGADPDISNTVCCLLHPFLFRFSFGCIATNIDMDEPSIHVNRKEKHPCIGQLEVGKSVVFVFLQTRDCADWNLLTKYDHPSSSFACDYTHLSQHSTLSSIS
jgi:hypothetical protein